MIDLAPYTVSTADFPFLADMLGGVFPQRVEFEWSRAERQICRKRKDIPTSKHAEKYRILTDKDSNRSGPWSNAVTPYLAGPMDAVFFPSVRHMVIVAPPQTGKSEAVNNIVGKAIDIYPGPVLYVYPTEKDAKKNIKRRVLTMIKASPRLAGYLSGKADDEAAALINLDHMLIRAGWAGSPQSLASTPERYVILEETDKYKEHTTSKETSTRLLAFKRTRTFRGREKIIEVSTPTTDDGPIWQALTTECEVIFEFVVVCPECFGHQGMYFGDRESDHGIKWPTDVRDPNLIESQEIAWYQCGECGAKWDDYLRDRAVAAGYWREKTASGSGLALFDYLEKKRPKRIGFQYAAWISTFVPLSECAAAFLRGIGNRSAMKDFWNGYAAEPWVEIIGKEKRVEEVQALKMEEAVENVVPSWALCLIMTCDVQGNGIWYELRAWGEGRTSQLIRHGFLAKGIGPGDDWDALRQVASSPYYAADRTEYRLRFGLLDSGYRTDEVYEFCRVNQIFAPSKGQQTKITPISYTKIDTFPGTGRLIPGGVMLVSFDTTHYKDALSSRLLVNGSDPGAWILHSTTDDGYCHQYTSEVKDEETGLWTQRGNQANHLWDCGVMQLVALEILEKRGEMARLSAARMRASQPKPANRQEEQKERPRLW